MHALNLTLDFLGIESNRGVLDPARGVQTMTKELNSGHVDLHLHR